MLEKEDAEEDPISEGPKEVHITEDCEVTLSLKTVKRNLKRTISQKTLRRTHC